MAIISLDLLGSCLHNLWLWMKVSKNWSRINSALPTTQKRHTVWKNVYYKSRYHPTCAKYFAHDCKSRKRTNKQLIPLRSQVPLLSYQKRGSFYYIQRIWRGGVLGRFIKIYHVGNYNIPSITKGSRGGGPQVSFFILCTSRPLGWPGPLRGTGHTPHAQLQRPSAPVSALFKNYVAERLLPGALETSASLPLGKWVVLHTELCTELKNRAPFMNHTKL